MRLRGVPRSGCCGAIWRHGLTSRRPSFTQSRPRRFAGLLLWLSRDLRLAAVTAGGFAGAGLAFAAGAWAWLGGLRACGAQPPGVVPASASLAVAALVRRPSATIVQVVALSFGADRVLVMAMVRTDLLRQWRAQIRRCAEPLHHQHPARPGSRQCRATEGAGRRDAQLFPMVRGRLVAITAIRSTPAGIVQSAHAA